MHNDFSRRTFLTIGTGCCGWTLCGPAPLALLAAERPQGDVRPLLNRFPRMVQEYFVAQVRKAERAAQEARDALKTKEDAQRYVEKVRAKIRESFGPFPEKTPLNPRITGVVDRDAYRIEKVIFESRPGFLVTGNLYVPKGKQGPRPGVIGVCGHSVNAKAAGSYQSFSQGLARLGYAVLIIDPLGQGERSQYAELSKPGEGQGVIEHLRAGNQQTLVGESLGAWRAWDAIRALDYLLMRPEVDPNHIGVTGQSGGGTLTTWLCGVDQRWTMAAPSCFVTTFRRNMENELPADPEQYPPRALALGLDHSDFLAAMAPKPVLILSQEKDYFDVRGTAEAFARLKRLYQLLGAEENIGMYIGPGGHSFSRDHREAMYRWFSRNAGVSYAGKEPALALEDDKTLWCAPGGQVANLKSRTVFSFTSDKSRQLTRSRPRLSATELVNNASELLRLPPMGPVPDYRILRRVVGRKYPKPECTSYAVETEPGIFALVHMLGNQPHYSRPPRGIPRAVLYVAHQSSDAEMRTEPLVAKLLQAEPKAAFYACDVRGIGESRPNTCGENTFLDPYGSDYFYAGHGLMLDRPYLGQRTFDVLRVMQWLQDQGHAEVHLAASGWGTLPATFAALLAPAVAQVTLKDSLRSYTTVAETENYDSPLSTMLPGVLLHFDLPDCYRALTAKKLRQIERR